MDSVGLEERVRPLIEEILDTGPIFLVDFSVRGSRGSHAVDIFIESDHALGVNQLAELSREIGFLLDTGDIMPGPYTLNVSTPGADRPLRLPRQYRKHLGRTLRVHYRKNEDACTEICGELIVAEDSSIQIQNGKRAIEILHDDIQWAKVQLPW
ncbi:MAG: ribosome maturation factor RimP [Bacteroidetes bacterium]|nr:ribosome maturation factor RimP [Bacteroidota bacterium]MCY4205336.1 ribosome maturation factor RimP [Bacteroidota bacterium]